ncbi:pentapeptide repeat-containing protein [Xanthobacter autotrophicus]|uniref:pentapeptide repeat-containing protein n=1 Tax=Xanthobacter autotrophicus TaxID=280 RepID=UPI0024AC219E|nr:pentapeptide repeat-containing protein [Xanthobacter autotrophicus]
MPSRWHFVALSGAAFSGAAFSGAAFSGAAFSGAAFSGDSAPSCGDAGATVATHQGIKNPGEYSGRGPKVEHPSG